MVVCNVVSVTDKSAFFAAIVMCVAGVASFLVMPVFVGAVVDNFALQESSAGYFAAAVMVVGVAAMDRRLVPYGAMTATFYTGVGCLLAPSVLFFAVRALV